MPIAMAMIVNPSVPAASATALASAARNAVQPGPGRRMIRSGSPVIGDVSSDSRSRVGASGR
jgi:hypothetical protein